jgi:hypothetical protein
VLGAKELWKTKGSQQLPLFHLASARGQMLDGGAFTSSWYLFEQFLHPVLPRG